jgi:hypothetical protein
MSGECDKCIKHSVDCECHDLVDPRKKNMTTLNEYLERLREALPDFIKASDLVELGIVGSRTTLATDRRENIGIPYVQFSKNRIRYPKDAVLKYIAEHFNETK